jgi:hypothetical protein
MKQKSLIAVIISVVLVFTCGCAKASTSSAGISSSVSLESSAASAASMPSAESSTSVSVSGNEASHQDSSVADSSASYTSVSDLSSASEKDFLSEARSAIEKMGYADIGGQQFKADIVHSEALAAYMHAGPADFGKSYLGCAAADFDKDGKDEAVFVTIEKDMKKITYATGGEEYQVYDFRLQLIKDTGSGAEKTSEIALSVESLPVECTCDFFYKDYGDHIGIFADLNGYEWTDDGGVGTLVEYGVKDGKLSVLDDTFKTFPGDLGYALSEDVLKGNFGEGAEADFETFGFALPDRSYNAPMIVDQDSSCIRIARILSSQDIDEQSAIDTPDLSGKLTYTVYSY